MKRDGCWICECGFSWHKRSELTESFYCPECSRHLSASYWGIIPDGVIFIWNEIIEEEVVLNKKQDGSVRSYEYMDNLRGMKVDLNIIEEEMMPTGWLEWELLSEEVGSSICIDSEW